ncbi:MAG TPA: helix-turn-helix domain-containing protein [Ktedonobacterales bacterium]|nr:helix-turn-helix domain-containing protein [Ktedonobacterales bacterium]
MRQALCRAGGRSVSTIQRAYKVELELNNAQTTACRKHAGAARWAYNWGLQRKQDEYRKSGKSPNAMELHRELNALKQTDVPWMFEVSKCAPQEALRNLDRALSRRPTWGSATTRTSWACPMPASLRCAARRPLASAMGRKRRPPFV